MEGRSGDEFLETMAEESQLNQTIDWTFNYDWKSSGDWSNYSKYEVDVPNKAVDIQPIKFIKKKGNE